MLFFVLLLCEDICLYLLLCNGLFSAILSLQVELAVALDQMDEIIQINSFDIGIMPLVNTPWENGKCGFKLIQYMACGVPVIASPVGINSQIVTNEVGFLANCKEDWIKYISVFIENKILKINVLFVLFLYFQFQNILKYLCQLHN